MGAPPVFVSFPLTGTLVLSLFPNHLKQQLYFILIPVPIRSALIRTMTDPVLFGPGNEMCIRDRFSTSFVKF